MEDEWSDILDNFTSGQPVDNQSEEDEVVYEAPVEVEEDDEDDYVADTPEVSRRDQYMGNDYDDEEDSDNELDLDAIMATNTNLYSTESTDVPTTYNSGTMNYSPAKAGSISEQIAKRESGSKKNPYAARALDRNGNEVSSATGKYQFLWGTHGKWIQKVTGVESREDFLNSPQAQEEAFAYWDKTTLTPSAMKYYPAIAKAIPNATLDDVKMMIHFAGEGNVQKAVNSGNFDRKLDSFGSSIRSYIGK